MSVNWEIIVNQENRVDRHHLYLAEKRGTDSKSEEDYLLIICVCVCVCVCKEGKRLEHAYSVRAKTQMGRERKRK